MLTGRTPLFRAGKEINEEAFSAAVKEKMDQLTIEKRLRDFRQYYSPKTFEGYCISKIEGLVGYGVDFWIGDVNFYSPGTKRYIKSPELCLNEEEFEKDQYNLNAAILVCGVSPSHLRSKASDAIEKALNLLHFQLASGSKLEVDLDHVIVDSEGAFWGRGWKAPERRSEVNLERLSIDRVISKPLQKEFGKELLKPLEEQNDFQRRISQALYWYRKGEEARSPEDKLLNYWIILETMLGANSFSSHLLPSNRHKKTPYLLSKECIPPVQVLGYIYEVGWELYHYLSVLLGSSHDGRHLLELPEELAASSGLNPLKGETVKLRDFIDKLRLLADAVDRRIIKEKILFVHKFYTKAGFALKTIKDRIEQILGDLLLIYR